MKKRITNMIILSNCFIHEYEVERWLQAELDVIIKIYNDIEISKLGYCNTKLRGKEAISVLVIVEIREG